MLGREFQMQYAMLVHLRTKAYLILNLALTEDFV